MMLCLLTSCSCGHWHRGWHGHRGDREPRHTAAYHDMPGVCYVIKIKIETHMYPPSVKIMNFMREKIRPLQNVLNTLKHEKISKMFPLLWHPLLPRYIQSTFTYKCRKSRAILLLFRMSRITATSFEKNNDFPRYGGGYPLMIQWK